MKRENGKEGGKEKEHKDKKRKMWFI